MSVILERDFGMVGEDMEYLIYQSWAVPPDDCVWLSYKDLIDLKRQIEEFLECQHL